MTNKLSEQQFELTPTIICIAESTHYLVGAVDEANNLTSLGQTSQVAVTSSLIEAKNYLRSHNIFNATLEFQTAYDEMCGLTPPAPCRQTITF